MHHHAKSLRRIQDRNEKNYPLFKNVLTGEGVSRFTSLRHCQTPSDTRFQEIGGNSPNISPNISPNTFRKNDLTLPEST